MGVAGGMESALDWALSACVSTLHIGETAADNSARDIWKYKETEEHMCFISAG